MKLLVRLFLTVSVFTFTNSALFANDWPSWRGPTGDGKLPESATYPIKWSPTENLRWEIELPAPGNSSPIVIADRLFLTLSEDEGHQRSLLCFDTNDGRQLWKKTVKFEGDEVTHRTNPWSAASPVSDGTSVYAWHGNAGLYAYDLSGTELWHRNLGSSYAHQWGPNAASPVLHEDNIIVHAGPGTEAALFCLDRKTGTTVWEQVLTDAQSETLKEFKGSWVTPFIFDNNGRTEMLIGLPQSLRSFDPATGKEWWRCQGLSDLCYTNAMVGASHAIYLSGYGGPGLGLTLPDANTTGDVTESHRLWLVGGKGSKKKVNPQRIGSGQIVGEYLYLLNEPGAAECIEVATGETQWKERLGRTSWSSMNYVRGHLYVNDQSGTTFVIEPDSASMKVIATNPLASNQHTNSSPAFSGGAIYLRTESSLYSIGK
tara:strand:+ start:132 stop:1418 length:1287 start_codon:yes stop_codon:yes gene_type:complete